MDARDSAIVVLSAFDLTRARGSRAAIGSCLAILAYLALGAHAARAENGLNLIGFGAESVLMGGADVAVARDTTALNTNPAGLTRIRGRVIDLFGAGAQALDVSHADQLGNDRKVSNDLIGLVGSGFAQRMDVCRCVVGVGLFAQGGAGYRYEDLQTPFATTDELVSLLGIARLAVGAAFDPTDRVSIGVSVSALYSTLDQRVFPRTSIAVPDNFQQSFFGLRLKDAKSLRPAVRVGMQYRPHHDWVIGVVYSPRVTLPMTDGSLEVNYTALGLGSVIYREARVDGFAQPQEAAIGFSFQLDPRVLLSAKLQWLDWSRAIRASTLSGRDPDNPLAPPEIAIGVTHNWRDQWIGALGVAVQASDRLTWYGGVNYGRNPVPSEHMSPILAAILEWHLTAGLAWSVAPGWSLSGGVEYQVRKAVTYTNPASLFGPAATERAEGIVVPLMLSFRW